MQISCKSAETQQQQSHPSSLSLSWFRRRRRRRLRILGEIQLWCFSFRPNRSYWFELILYTITYCIKEKREISFSASTESSSSPSCFAWQWLLPLCHKRKRENLFLYISDAVIIIIKKRRKKKSFGLERHLNFVLLAQVYFSGRPLYLFIYLSNETRQPCISLC